MASIDDAREQAATFRQRPNGSGEGIALSDIEGLVNTIAFDGNLAALIACACEKALMDEPASHADPGVQAAIRAFAAWKQAEGQTMATDIRHHSDHTEPLAEEPEILPLSLAGKWVAWSSDGMRIVAASESSEEAEQLAIAAGEPEPILERHPGRYRL